MCYILWTMLRAFTLLLVLAAGGCSWLRPAPVPILPPEELYQLGEAELEKKRFPEAREHFRKLVERHPNSSYAPRARFLIGEAFYRDAEFDKAAKEFEAFLAFYPRHEIADLVQYRYAMSYYDQIKPIEQDQGLAAKAMEQFKKLVKEYPESRYATDALAKIDVCRGRLAQKEVWVAAWYIGQGNPSGARSGVLQLPAGDFSLSATPSSRSVRRNQSTTYTVTVTPVDGFAGAVTFSVSGLPGGASASFNPTSVTGSGTTTMTVTAGNPRGTFTLTITGTSGSLQHSATVTLTVTK